jgi:hypothetical protein
MNLYDYANNDPINGSDQLGLAAGGSRFVFQLGAVENVNTRPTFFEALVDNFPGSHIFDAGLLKFKDPQFLWDLGTSMIPGSIVSGLAQQVGKKVLSTAAGKALGAAAGGSMARAKQLLQEAITKLPVHGNAKDAVGDYYVYAIRDNVTGEILKIGTTGRGIVNRFNQQIDQLRAWITHPNPVHPEEIAKHGTNGLATQHQTALLNAWGKLHGGKQGNIAKNLPKWNKNTR